MGDANSASVEALLTLLAQNQDGQVQQAPQSQQQTSQPPGHSSYRTAAAGYAPYMVKDTGYDMSRIKPTASGVIYIGDFLALADKYGRDSYGDRDGYGRYSPPPDSGRGGHRRSPSPRRRTSNRDGAHVIETMTFNSALVGRIIGRGGETLRKLEKDTGARVQFLADNKSGERSADISGTRAQVEDARNAIWDLIGPVQGSSASSGNRRDDGGRSTDAGPAKVTFMVPDRCVGLIIGRGGESVSEIQKKSGARVNIVPENEAVNGLRPINLFGTAEGVSRAKEMIEEIVDHDLDSGGSTTTKTALASQPAQRIKPESPQTSNHTEIITVPNDSVGMLIGKGGENIREIQAATQARVHIAGEPSAQSPSLREITLVGDERSVNEVKKLIEHKLQSQPWSGKTNRNPANNTGGGMPVTSQPSADNQSGNQAQDPYAAFGGYEAVAAYWAQQAALQQQQQQ